MADFAAQIQLSANALKAYQEIGKLEKRINRLDKKASDIDLKVDVDRNPLRQIERFLNRLTRDRTVKIRVDQTGGAAGAGAAAAGGIGVGGLAAAGALGGSIANALNPTRKAEQATKDLASAID